ncbi:hypothetical protein ACB094_03G077500 [Castanea mollissima]
MALFRTRSSLHQAQKIHSLLLNPLFIFFLLSIPHAKSIHFNFSSFQPNESNLTFQGNAYADSGLQITKNTRTCLVNSSVGRVSFHNQVCLWDNSTGRLTDFPGDTFGLFSNETALYDTQNKIVAVEFDTYKNSDFTDQSDNHVGIDVNSIVSKTYASSSRSFNRGSTVDAWVSYNSTTTNLSVFLTFADNPVFSRYSSSLSYIVDLKAVLPEWVRVGFSAATGDLVESHTIPSWSFSSNLEPKHRFTQPNKTKNGGTTHPNKTVDGNHKKKPGLWIGLAVALGVVSCALGLLWFIHWRKRTSQNTKDHLRDDVCMDDEFEKGTGPRSFTYRELIRATNNFTGGKLGEGGFGGVYKGLLSESNVDVAVKRVSEGSKQGRKEHRNLVQLIGWCHEHDELLLVYEYMPNGSLDSHLYGAKTTLTWPGRYNVVQGLACALLYLHEEWEQCIVHRDIKPSNIMLDTNFNAKLGDFGTMGYLAPECATSGKASKESDVYSFGMVSLEIVCGRKPIDPQTEPNKVNLVEWVWELYGKGQLLEAVDLKLNMEFDKEQIQCLMVVGLWCCHPDPAPLPNLPSKLLVSTFGSPMHKYKFSNTSSLMGSKDQTQCSCGSSSTNLSTSDGPSKPLPCSGKVDVQLASIVN